MEVDLTDLVDTPDPAQALHAVEAGGIAADAAATEPVRIDWLASGNIPLERVNDLAEEILKVLARLKPAEVVVIATALHPRNYFDNFGFAFWRVLQQGHTRLKEGQEICLQSLHVGREFHLTVCRAANGDLFVDLRQRSLSRL